MAGRSPDVVEGLQRLFRAGTAAGLSDGQLLERFLDRRDPGSEGAFAALVERHGPMVLSVCRRVLQDPHDAEDASQTVFLVLAHRAGSIRKADSLASWLFGVACRVAARAKADAARRRTLERQGAEMVARRADDGQPPESWPELYEELERLPEKLRAPLVLCYLEGLSHEQAAGQLRWTVRTIRSRLSRGRERLRGRLARRGVTPSGVLLAPASARMGAAWVEHTARAAVRIAAGEATAAVASGQVTLWTEGVLRSMYITRVFAVVASVAMIAGAGATAWWGAAMAAGGAGQGPGTPPPAAVARGQIPPYELRAATAADPADVSPSLVAILGDSRLKMMGYVGRMAYTPDGRSLVSAGNNEVAFWDPQTGELRRVLRGHSDQVVGLAISRDARTLVSGSRDHLVKVWDVAEGKERLTLKGHANLVSAVAISDDGRLVASADGEVRTWDISGGRQRVHMKRLGEHVGSAGGLAFSPDGRMLVSAGDDGTIKVWDIAGGRLVKELEPSRERWKAVAFSPDGATLAAAGFDHGLVLFDVAGWTIKHGVPVPQNDLGAQALAFFPDGRRLALSQGFTAHIIDVTTGKELWRSPKQTIGMNAIAVSPDGATIASTGVMIKLWDVASGKEKTPKLAGHAGGVEAVAYSPDGSTLATGSSDQTVKLWDLATRRERTTLTALPNHVQSVAFSPDGRSLAAVGFSGELALWELPSGKLLRSWKEGGNRGWKVRYSPDGRWIAVEMLSRMGGRSLEIWDRATGRPKGQFEAGDGTYLFTPDSKEVVFAGLEPLAARKRRLLVWDIEGEKVKRTIEDGALPSQIHGAVLSPDGRVLAMAGWDHRDDEKGKPVIILWGLAEDRPLYRLDQWADHLAYAPDGRTLLGVGRDGLTLAWDPRNGTLRETIRVCEPGTFAIRDIAAAPDNRHFAAALGNGTARVFRLRPAPETIEPRPTLPPVAARPVTPTDLWKQLIGRPAPEFRGIKAWAGGPPATLADLRGKFVLLHFWNLQSEFQVREMMALHDKFAEQGLVIIVVQRDWGVSSVEDWQAHAVRVEDWDGRTLPFRVALDGGGPTPIEETDVKGPGATYAAFGIQESRDGWRLPGVNLLIGPDGRVLQGWEAPAFLQRELEARMGVKAKVPEWRRRLDQKYALADGQVLKRVGPPYPPERDDYLFYSLLGGRPDPDRSQVFRWDGRLNSSASLGSHRLRDVLGFVVKLGSGEFEGPAELLDRPVPGDWIVRQGASQADLLKAMEAILADELKMPVRFAPREVEREVIVARGRYRFHPLGDRPGERFVHLGTESLAGEDGGGGGAGTLKGMLNWLGDRVGRAVVDETESSNESVQWRDHLARTMREMASDTESGRALLGRMLENVAKQTSLTFRLERRKVRVWEISGP